MTAQRKEAQEPHWLVEIPEKLWNEIWNLIPPSARYGSRDEWLKDRCGASMDLSGVRLWKEDKHK